MGSRILLPYVIHDCVYLLRWRADSDKYSQWSHPAKNCYSKKYLTRRSPFIWTIKYINFSNLSCLASSSGESTENRGHSSIFISCSLYPYQTRKESVWRVQWEEKLFSKHLEQGTNPIGSILTYVDKILLLRHLHLLPLSIMLVPQAKSSILELIMWLLEMQEWCN